MNPITVFLTVVCLAIGVALGAIGYLYAGIAVVVVAVIVAAALKMANTWEKFVILRAGKLRGVKGPGLFLIIPVIDHVIAIIDERIQTTAFSAEAALTKDTVPVNVDAIIFWFVHDAQKAALNITNYREAIDRVAQTSLREMIGSSMLAALLSERTAADELLRGEIARKTADWGISVKSVEIRDVAIPVALQDAMSRQAQAEREKQARVILGSAEAAIAGKFVEAAMTYANHPWRFAAARHEHHLRDDQGARRHHPDADIDGRQHESRGCAGVGRGSNPRRKRRRVRGPHRRRRTDQRHCRWINARNDSQ